MSNPSHGVRFIKDDAATFTGAKKQHADISFKMFQDSKMSGKMKKKRRK